MGGMKNFKVNIPIDKAAKPKFFRARPVPYALKEGMEKELVSLQSQDIYKRI